MADARLSWDAPKALAGRLLSQLLGEVAIRSLRSSFLTAGAMLLVSSLGAWQFLISSTQGLDMRTAANEAAPMYQPASVVMVAIDDTAFQRYFDERSPLRQDRLAEFLKTVAEAAPNARRIVVDLDLAPHQDDVAAAQMANVLREHAPRWVLAAAQGSTPFDETRRSAWRKSMCSSGVNFGSPMVPTEFGHARISHQFDGALSEVAADPRHRCMEPGASGRIQASPLSPLVLKNGMVLPFSGDLNQLTQHLQALDPQWVVVGGTWGKEDRFLTPFGERYGVQVHAAALAGRLHGDRQIPFGLQLILAWIFVTVTAVLLTLLDNRLRAWATPGREVQIRLAGHEFFIQRIRPILLMCVVLLLLFGLSRLLGWFWGRSGIWIPSGTVISVTGIAVMLIWNWGKNQILEFHGLKATWQRLIFDPIKLEWHALQQASLALFGRGDPQGLAVLGKPRLAFEACMSLTSLGLQTLLPTLSCALALSKPL